MRRERVTIISRLGLHARAASKLVSVASQFSSQVWIERENKRINGKSIMGVLTLAAGQGVELIIETSGEDEDKAVHELLRLIQNRFGEDN